MKNILIISPIMPPEIGGPASYVPAVMARLPKNYRFKVITFTPSANPIKNVPIISISQNGWILFRQMRLFWSVLKESRWADLFFVQEPLIAGVATALVKMITNKPTVIRFVGYQPWEELLAKGSTKKFLDGFLENPDGGIKSRLYFFFTWLAFKMAGKIIVPSKYLHDVLVKYFSVSEDRICHIYNAFELPKITPLPKNKTKTAISIGRLIVRKHVDWTIQAVAHYIKNTGHKIQLLVVGDGPDRPRLEKLAKYLAAKNKIKPFTKFLGRKSWLEGLSILGSADVYLLTSVYEGLPFTVLESLSLGIPVIATEIPGTNEVAINGYTALTAKPGDIKELARISEQILDDNKLSKKLVMNGKKLINEKFAWSENIRYTREVFNSL